MKKTYENRRREPYIGSVRFFRQLLLGTFTLLILILACTSIILSKKYHNLQERFKEENNLVLQQAAQIFELQQALAGREQQQPAPSESAEEEAEGSAGETSASVDRGRWELVFVNAVVDERIVPMLESMLKDPDARRGYQPQGSLLQT